MEAVLATFTPEQLERFSIVENWLKNILRGSSIPVFELNEDTLSILENCKLYFDNLEQYEEDHQFQMKLETEEFHVEKNRLNVLLSSLALNPAKDVKSDTRTFAKSLQRTSVELNVSKPTLTSCMAAAGCLQDRIFKSESHLETAAEQLENLQRELVNLEKLETFLEQKFEELENTVNKETIRATASVKDIQRNKLKSKEYKEMCSSYKSQLKRNKFCEELTSHSAICRLNGEHECLKNRLLPLELQLKSYLDLPMDSERAREKLVEKKYELEAVEEKLTKLLSGISLEGQSAKKLQFRYSDCDTR